MGVSWFNTSVDVPANWTGKRITLQFDAVRFRAEVFVNHQLAGYDLVNSTPFSIDITPYVKLGQKNDVAIRITDPNGNFNWKDSQCYAWGNYLTNPSHGFGGITGRVHLCATDRTYIDDVFVENTPVPSVVKVHVEVELLVALHRAHLEPTEAKTLLHLVVAQPQGQFVQVGGVDTPQSGLWQ